MSTTVIKIESPCSQNWEKMENLGAERFCEQCNKCVIDFTTQKDSEIIRLLTNSTTEICGRFNEEQLKAINHQLNLKTETKIWLKYTAALAIGMSIFVSSIHAQEIKQVPQVEFSKPKKKTNHFPKKIDKIYGYVFDSNQKPVAGLKVSIINSKLFAITNSSGKYEFTLGKNFDLKNNVLYVTSRISYGRIDINFSTERQQNLYVKTERFIMGRIAVVRRPEVKLTDTSGTTH